MIRSEAEDHWQYCIPYGGPAAYPPGLTQLPRARARTRTSSFPNREDSEVQMPRGLGRLRCPPPDHRRRDQRDTLRLVRAGAVLLGRAHH